MADPEELFVACRFEEASKVALDLLQKETGPRGAYDPGQEETKGGNQTEAKVIEVRLVILQC